jgi:enamine deaminase RidA (YjgF/YER057c/UK114 family)
MGSAFPGGFVVRTALAALFVVSLPAATRAAELKYFPADPHTGGSVAVEVGDEPLVHTAQFADNGTLEPVEPGRSAAEQTDLVLGKVLTTIEAAGGDAARVVKLNVVVTNAADVAPVRKAIEKKFPAGKRPAVGFVVGKLPFPKALVAIDAVAPAKGLLDGVKLAGSLKGVPPVGGAHAAVLPAGRRVYVSGQAEKGESPVEAARKTLASLRATLKWLGLDDSHVVQCKSFLRPISAAGEVTKVFDEHFGNEKCPPLVFVEWDSTLPIEIELVASAPMTDKPATGVEYLTPPGMTASPIYCRVTRVASDRFLYTGGLVAAKGGSGEEQVAAVFTRLSGVLKDAGGDFKHLVKATYYVSDEDASGALNKLRPKYYDPKRPPAASKAKVAGTGFEGRTLVLDMIAVPAPK